MPSSSWKKSLFMYLSLNDDPSYVLSQIGIIFLPKSNYTLQINVLFCISFIICETVNIEYFSVHIILYSAYIV